MHLALRALARLARGSGLADLEAGMRMLAQARPLGWRQAPWVWVPPSFACEAGYRILGAPASAPGHERLLLEALAQQSRATLVGAGLAASHATTRRGWGLLRRPCRRLMRS